MKSPPPDDGSEAGPVHLSDKTQDRMVDFSVRIIAIADQLPATPAGRHVAGQILRSGTSPAPNYGEARAAESREDFIHKLGVVHKELNETFVWLLVIQRGQLLTADIAKDVDECDQLCRIIGASRSTAKANSGDQQNRRWRS